MGLIRALPLLLLLAGCPRQQADAAVEQTSVAAADVAHAITETAATTTPAIVELQDAAIALVPPAPPSAPSADPRVITHFVKWEVSSPSTYTAKWQGVICPGLASGPTWGIGYDGGQTPRAAILSDWSLRHDAQRLAGASGQTGNARCRPTAQALRDVRVPYAQASYVFSAVSYPAWERITDRAYPGADKLPVLARGALVGNTYNRGTSMAGSRNAEKRHIRDECVPRGDTACIATQLRAMKRLWPDTPGLRARRDDEARMAETAP